MYPDDGPPQEGAVFLVPVKSNSVFIESLFIESILLTYLAVI